MKTHQSLVRSGTNHVGELAEKVRNEPLANGLTHKTFRVLLEAAIKEWLRLKTTATTTIFAKKYANVETCQTDSVTTLEWETINQ